MFPVEFGISIGPATVPFDLNGAGVTLKLQIIDSKILAVCEAAALSPGDDLLNLYIRVLETTRTVVDLAALSKGIGLTVVFERIIRPGGSVSPITFTNYDLASRCKSFNADVDPSFTEMVGLVLQEPSLSRALNEVVSSLTVLGHSDTGCARGIEILKQIVAPGLDAQQQWVALRKNLNVSEVYLKVITGRPKGHGTGIYRP